MPKYCCFWHPKKDDYEDKKLEDKCPECGRSYGYVLENPPKTIGQYTIDRAIDRGFYSVVYAAKRGAFGTKIALKVAPKSVYEFYGKNFEAECNEHHRIAQQTDHIIAIHDLLSDRIAFSDGELDCDVAELDYVEGESLAKYLSSSSELSARTIAQIAIDLFKILQELSLRGTSHNDLHDGNIIVCDLPESSRRLDDAIDEKIRALVVDLGSLSEESKSSDTRLGDIHWVVKHLRLLVSRLLEKREDCSPEEYRLAQVLEGRSYQLSPSATSQRVLHFNECIADIQSTFSRVSKSWFSPLELRSLDHGYNAQALDPWHVPYLIVDPDEKWLRQISAPGPQIITGMRGCGKTMLLLSLQFHARAALRSNESEEVLRERILKDSFLGLYVSGNKLLSTIGRTSDELVKPLEKLFVGYALDAARAVRHLEEIDTSLIERRAHSILSTAVADYLNGADDLTHIGSSSELENTLLQIIVSLNRGEGTYSISAHPTVVFSHLADAIRGCSVAWTDNTVLFLLDDVSTRYFEHTPIQSLFSSLLFQAPQCAFKITSEAQTLELVLKSPGQTERARAGRDYDVFDLGSEVLQQMKIGASRSGIEFIEKILALRTEHTVGLESLRDFSPRAVLGDCSLASIAENICAVGKTSSQKKRIYHGISALASVCVGDIGDIITLYEMIIGKGAGKKIPIDPGLQSECYQDLCSRRLYHLARRGGELRDFALSFAEASHKLLVLSKKKAGADENPRLREYLKVYVRVTTGDADWQFNKLRELIDAGVFVLEGGSDTPRTKTKDWNPVKQFILAYRKLFGLSNFIGLAERDRFELSGRDLEAWLSNPADGRTILTRNLTSGQPEEALEDENASVEASEERSQVQQELWQGTNDGYPILPDELSPNSDIAPNEEDMEFAKRCCPEVQRINTSEMAEAKINTLVCALGFEERAIGSIRYTLSHLTPKRAVLVGYDVEGRTKEIIEELSASNVEILRIDQKEVITEKLPDLPGTSLIDVSAMAKPLIFTLIKESLVKQGQVYITHTDANEHYPLNEDIEKVLSAEEEKDHHSLLDELERLLRGERGPYTIQMLQGSNADETRKRVLCAFASAKHERLLTFLDERDFDTLDIFLIDNDTPRSRLAAIASDVARKRVRFSVTTAVDTNDLDVTIRQLGIRYHQWFIRGGCNLELALTGSKIQAAAAGAVCAAFKMSHCWYVKPEEYDVDRFSKGVGRTEFYRIALKT